MKTYDRVKIILETIPETRNSDKLLIWEYYKADGRIQEMQNQFGVYQEALARNHFLSRKITSTESITRARRKIQEIHPELAPTSSVVAKRRSKREKTKGTFVYREDTRRDIFD